ncbi:recombinase family protein [Catenulispora pinistramenti]|uniref:recombinase family protein n=1 Tax=Catenulispora pinistramenti TaxID=2705254 RepID=UPI001E2E811B|nr:recombinase family protein [Catenulispora pinistramenti]
MAVLGEAGAVGALYCCVPRRGDGDQTPVDVQERQGRKYAAGIGITVPAHLVFADERRSVWNAGSERPGWAALLTAVRSGRVPAVLLLKPLMLVRHRPADAVELLIAAQEHGVDLYSTGDTLDLTDPSGREAALSQARQFAGKAASLSKTVQKLRRQNADDGRPHGGGRRAYGYGSGMHPLIEEEAQTVRQIYARFLAGDSLRAIAGDLNTRGIPTVTGATWTTGGVSRILDAPRYAGLRVFQGGVESIDGLRRAVWEPCVDIEDWKRAQAERAARSAAADNRPRADYLLTGLVVCERCRDHMVGSIVGDYRMYACASKNKPAPDRCNRHIGAKSLEEHVQQAAVEVLQQSSTVPAPSDLPVTVRRGPVGSPGRPDQFRTGHGRVETQSAYVLDGVVTGPEAPSAWWRLPEPRRRDVLRFLFASIEIGDKTTSRSVFDTSRIKILPGLSLD